MGISPVTVSFLNGLGHDAIRLPAVGLDRRADTDVIAYAIEHGQVVLTFDLDYPAIMALNPEIRISAVIFRTESADPSWINHRLSETLQLTSAVLTEGAVVVVEDDRIRVRRFVDF